MKKLNLAIIGQGRSGRNIHGAYLKTEKNIYYNVVAVVEHDAKRREIAKTEYPGCEVYSDYRELFNRDDIDLIVNASFSEMHYEITLDLLRHGRNVIEEKPMARNMYECQCLLNAAKESGSVFAVFQQSLYDPSYVFVKEVIESGKLGKTEQVSIRYNSLARRWDWQTLQSRLAGSVYNTGPHPIGYGLDIIGFENKAEVVYSRLATELTSGDGEDYAKILMTAKDRPLIDIEISAIDAYSNFMFKVQGSRGTLKVTPKAGGFTYEMKYIVDGENVERPVQYETLRTEEGLPTFCKETLVTHTESGEVDGDAFTVGTPKFYEMVYDTLTNGTPLKIRPEDIAKVVWVMEKVHADNPLPVKY